MEYRLDKNKLLDTLGEWNRFLKRKVHLIACGGTAMTLLGVKPSTKDVDFMTPDIKEHAYLTKQLRSLGYKQVTGFGWQREGEVFRFDIFRGNSIHTTALLESPLEKGRNTPLKEFSQLYIGILNEYDLISSKLMRGTRVDFDDCLMLATAHKGRVDIDRLVAHFHEMISYDVSEKRLKPHIDYFVERLRKNGLYD
jgi:hypothetical protein